MKNLIYIENENLADYIMFSLDKIDNGFTEEELDKITEVLLDFESEKEKSITFLEDFSKLKNLKSITLRNGHIFNKIYNLLIFFYIILELMFYVIFFTSIIRCAGAGSSYAVPLLPST